MISIQEIEANGYRIYRNGKIWSDRSNKYLSPTNDSKGYPKVTMKIGEVSSTESTPTPCTKVHTQS